MAVVNRRRQKANGRSQSPNRTSTSSGNARTNAAHLRRGTRAHLRGGNTDHLNQIVSREILEEVEELPFAPLLIDIVLLDEEPVDLTHLARLRELGPNLRPDSIEPIVNAIAEGEDDHIAAKVTRYVVT